jgi:hypothetical protein
MEELKLLPMEEPSQAFDGCSCVGLTKDQVLHRLFLYPAQSTKPVRLAREGLDMTLGVGNIVALICIVISIIFAIVTHQATNALWWALLAIFAVLWWGARAPWGN